MKKIFTLFAVVLLSQHLFATIHYTSVNDDVYNVQRTYDVDLDGDNDFSFDYTSINYADSVHCLKATSFYAANGTTDLTPKAYAASAGMGTYHWVSGSALVVGGAGGPFDGTVKYLQVKFSNGAHTYYGWFELSAVNSDLTITGYAYNDVADAPITPGDKGNTGINEIATNFLGVNKITANNISFSNCESFDKATVSTLEGKVISTIEHPNAGQNYPMEQTKNVLIVAFYKNEKLVASTKYVVAQ